MKQLTTLALIGIAYFVIVIVTLHFLRTDLNPISRSTSEYAVGPYGFLMTTAFLSMSVASLSLVIGLYKGMPQSARSRIGLILLGIWGVGVLVAMSFPINPEGSRQTITGIIHRFNGPFGIFKSDYWLNTGCQKFRARYTLATYLSFRSIPIIGYACNFCNYRSDHYYRLRVWRRFPAGFLIVFTTWFILTTLHLRSTIAN